MSGYKILIAFCYTFTATLWRTSQIKNWIKTTNQQQKRTKREWMELKLVVHNVFQSLKFLIRCHFEFSNHSVIRDEPKGWSNHHHHQQQHPHNIHNVRNLCWVCACFSKSPFEVRSRFWMVSGTCFCPRVDCKFFVYILSWGSLFIAIILTLKLKTYCYICVIPFEIP